MDYLKYINEYGENLNEKEKPIARKLFNDLLRHGWSLEQIFHGIRLLKDRPLSQYKGLFYFQDFKREIDQEIEEVRRQLNISQEEKIKKLEMLIQHGYNSIPEQYKERLLFLDDFIHNQVFDTEEERNSIFTEEELKKEIDFMYEVCELEPSLLFPLALLDEDDARARYFYKLHKSRI